MTITTEPAADALKARICADLRVLATAIECDCGVEIVDLAEVHLPAGTGTTALEVLAEAIDDARADHQAEGCSAEK